MIGAVIYYGKNTLVAELPMGMDSVMAAALPPETTKKEISRQNTLILTAF